MAACPLPLLHLLASGWGQVENAEVSELTSIIFCRAWESKQYVTVNRQAISTQPSLNHSLPSHKLHSISCACDENHSLPEFILHQSALHPHTFHLPPSTSHLPPPTSNLQPSTFNLKPQTSHLTPSTPTLTFPPSERSCCWASYFF